LLSPLIRTAVFKRFLSELFRGVGSFQVCGEIRVGDRVSYVEVVEPEMRMQIWGLYVLNSTDFRCDKMIIHWIGEESYTYYDETVEWYSYNDMNFLEHVNQYAKMIK
jgi:hypothetical protein